MFKVGSLLVVLIFIFKSGNPQLTQISSTYHMSSVAVELIQAYAICKRNGYTLLTEKNENETLAINAAIKAAGLYPDHMFYWLSGVNVTQGEFEPAFIWIESIEEFEYTNWAPRQPDEYGNCVTRSYIESQDPPSDWNSQDCSDQIWFICQKP